MNAPIIDEILDEGTKLMRTIGLASMESFSVRIGWSEGFSRRTIKHEEVVLGNILSSMRDYMQKNLLVQQSLIKSGLSDNHVTVGDQLSVVQSQKQSIEGIIAVYIDSIAYHRSEVNTITGQMLTAGAVVLALLTVITSLIR